MALKFYWRCESETLDSTHDYSAGATTMTASGAVSISATAAKLGSNGVLTFDGSDYYYCSPTSIANANTGSFGWWVKWVTTLPANTSFAGISVEQTSYTTTDNVICPRINNANELSASARSAGVGFLSKLTTAANVVADTWYFLTMSWDLPNDKFRMRVYNASGTLIEEANNDTDLTDLSTVIPTSLDTLAIGQRTGSTVVTYVDNVFVGDSYDDADTFLTKRNITSYTEYNDSSSPLILPHRSSGGMVDLSGNLRG